MRKKKDRSLYSFRRKQYLFTECALRALMTHEIMRSSEQKYICDGYHKSI